MGDVASVRGRRTIPAAELFAGPLESTLAHDEVAVEALFPALAEGAGVAFQEIARRHGDYALVGVAALVELDGGEVTRARVGYVSVSDVPVVVDVTDALADPAAKALAELDPADDIHASAAYRAHLVKVLTPRVLAAATEHARERKDS
jgi:2-furoyl-CoA dehydrogenase FAD binding subunit